MKRNPLSIIVGAVLLIIFGVLLFMFQVRLTEVAVVTTFGKPTRQIMEAGPYFKWPWPVQWVHKFDKRLHNFDSKLEQVRTADEYNLLINVYVGWRINEPMVFFPRFEGSVPRAEDSLEGLVRNAYSGVVGNHPLSHFISTDEQELRFEQIEREMLAHIQRDLVASEYGIEATFLGIKSLRLPESVTEAVFQQMEAEREVLINQIKSEGTEQASSIRTAAELESAKLLADAQAEATKMRGLGDAEAAKSFEVLEQNPELANFLYKLDTLEAFLKDKATLILDPNTAPLDLLMPSPAPATKTN